MLISKFFYCFMLLGFLMSCKNDKPQLKKEPKATIETVETISPNPKKLTVEEKLQSLDTINEKNAIDFLIAYGKKNREKQVLIKTRLGDIRVVLYDDTPLHRANFIFLIKMGYFDTTCFHRVVPDFIVQGGNSESLKTLNIRNKYRNYTIPPEFRKNRRHKYGALAAAREWENNISKKSNPFEFYIIQAKNGAYHIDGEHTVFGEVISGFDILDKIAIEKAGRDEWPFEDVYMEMVLLDSL